MKKINFYFENSTLHGFAYIVGRKHWIEKFFWVVAILCSQVCCLLLLYEIILKVKHNPVIVYQPENSEFIENIPFPAISFCPEFVIDKKIEVVSSFLKDKHPFDLESCFEPSINKECYFKNNTNDILEILEQFRLNLQIDWQRKFRGSHVITLSSYNWCNTFNIVDHSELYYKNSTAEYFSYKASMKEMIIGLFAVLQQNTKKSPFYTAKSDLGMHGFVFDEHFVTVVIHSPFETPDFRHRSFVLSESEIVRISIEPVIRITDETLLDLEVDERHCYKPDEYKLQYFKTYTSINCLRECESSFILQKCGCVPYYFINNDTSLICSTTQLDCFYREYEEFDEVKCRCYPPCRNIDYEFVLQKFSSTFTFAAYTMEIVAKFKFDNFYPQIRRKYFTMIDWFSFVGGILGLFFGFSILSAFEIIFYFSSGLFSWRSTKIFNDDKIFWRRKISVKELMNNFKLSAYLKNLMKDSTVHSFRYIFGSDFKVKERIAWIIVFILSILSCAFMIRELRHKFIINSVSIISMNNYINISNIPFPAITIMGDVRSFTDGDPSAVYNYEKYAIEMIILRNEDKKHLNENEVYEFNMKIPEPLKKISNYGHKIIPYARKINDQSPLSGIGLVWNEEFSVTTAETITSMVFGHSFNIIPCHEMFHESKISDDFLYNFKYHFKGGHRKKILKYPLKPSYRNHESIEINYYQNPDYSQQSYMLASIHSSFEYPMQILSDEVNSFGLNMPRTLEILITPEVVTVDKEKFNKLPLSQRNCYMENERKLKFFKIYTQRNCEIECLSELLLKYCDCVPFDLIRSKDTKICELRDYECIDMVKNDTLFDDNYCSCLQPCSYISYNLEAIDIKHHENSTEGIIKIRFKENEIISMERIQRFTIFDFLSYIGGLLGLFAGISVLSLFEIFYFFTLRLICEILRFKRKRQRVECFVD